MPSPVAHSLMGYTIYRATGKLHTMPKWPRFVFCLFSANAADLDFIPGFIVLDPNRFHHGISHSLGWAALYGLIFGIIGSRTTYTSFRKGLTLSTVLYGSHVLLDFFSMDTTPPYGEPLFWPLTEKYYMSKLILFMDIQRESAANEFIWSIFTVHNLAAVGLEILWLMPLLAVTLYLTSRIGSVRK